MKLPSLLAPGRARARIVYRGVWLLLALPLPVTLVTGLVRGIRGRDEIVLHLGLWAVRILILGLALSPAARLLRQPGLHRYKRTLGLFGFTYALLHGAFYIVWGRVWDFPLRVWERRLYIPLGILALVLMLPLAVTSTNGMMRRLGPGGWRRLHRSVYPTLLIAGVHGLWQNNIDHAQPAIYLALIVILLVVRLPSVMQALLSRLPRRSPASLRPLSSR